jgi:hypothetical protein
MLVWRELAEKGAFLRKNLTDGKEMEKNTNFLQEPEKTASQPTEALGASE